MSLFIAVAFFCVGDNCYFWKSKENYYTEASCKIALVEYVNKKSKETDVAASCLEVSLRNNI